MVFGIGGDSKPEESVISHYGSIDEAGPSGQITNMPILGGSKDEQTHSIFLGSGSQPISSSSSSSRSSVLIDDDVCDFASNDAYQRQPLIIDSKEQYRQQNSTYQDTSDNNYNGCGSGNSSHSNGGLVKITMPGPHRDETRFPKEKCKTMIGFVFLFLNFIFTTASLALTHERVPRSSPPLPDAILDNINVQRWGLEASEIMIIVSVYICILIIVFHKHRFIIFRRLFLIMGLLYFYRSITMYVTVLPVADSQYYCSPKANTTNVMVVLKRVVQLLSGFGLSINGQHTFCGDYIYSGHTVCLVMAYLIVREYTPRRWWPLHWLFALFATLGVVFVLIARGHYTVDCIIAYWITTRLFYLYHTLANNQHLQDNSTTNYFERLWWYPIFRYFECNVQGVVPRHYEWPLPWPRRWGAKNPQRTY